MEFKELLERYLTGGRDFRRFLQDFSKKSHVASDLRDAHLSGADLREMEDHVPNTGESLQWK